MGGSRHPIAIARHSMTATSAFKSGSPSVRRSLLSSPQKLVSRFPLPLAPARDAPLREDNGRTEREREEGTSHGKQSEGEREAKRVPYGPVCRKEEGKSNVLTTTLEMTTKRKSW